jgi:Fur family ferric uptake transcriptional regulator
MRRVPASKSLDSAAIERALGRLQGHVREQGLKASGTRELIARAALRRRGHFAADDLLADLRAAGHGDIHTATVYRVLPLLVEAGLLQVTLVSSRQGTHYERAFEREHHDHLICTTCGKVVEFEFEAIEVLQRDVAESFGFHLTGHVHELLGTCATCRAAG